MSHAKIVEKDIRKIFGRHVENINRILFTECNGIKTCDGKHSEYVKKARGKMYWYKQCSLANVALTMILVLTIFGLIYFRSINHADRYGGCMTEYFWPFDECPTVF